MLNEISYSGPIPRSIYTQKDPVFLSSTPVFLNVFTTVQVEIR